jgi:hypothetical protein
VPCARHARGACVHACATLIRTLTIMITNGLRIRTQLANTLASRHSSHHHRRVSPSAQARRRISPHPPPSSTPHRHHATPAARIPHAYRPPANRPRQSVYSQPRCRSRAEALSAPRNAIHHTLVWMDGGLRREGTFPTHRLYTWLYTCLKCVLSAFVLIRRSLL